ncbi:meh1p [Saccharomyces arboricola H-6]|uniref:Meh1p n=1 Tax=Saccharomyces arboricola (strain H-6 / AS 2.3317 / CBS 10644) TaxID=1160507 RepID=J8Q2P1_SACAR|nr:meh1p [Saccharomyces arboricola H-6]
MGIVFSCCKHHASEEDEALLREQQAGYGTQGNANDEYDAEQVRLKEHEQKLLAREQELREIVANTNDKLIDISMINNSGIVIQGTDLQEALDKREREEGAGAGAREDEGITGEDNTSGRSASSSRSEEAATRRTVPKTNTFTALTTPDSTKISKEQLKRLHSRILDEISSQSQVDKPGPLTVPF